MHPIHSFTCLSIVELPQLADHNYRGTRNSQLSPPSNLAISRSQGTERLEFASQRFRRLPPPPLKQLLLEFRVHDSTAIGLKKSGMKGVG
jgi:hypothetical protein